MNLEPGQKQTIAQWINEGMKLADIQKRMDTELGIRITYMELRVLVAELAVMPKDPPKPVEPAPKAAAPSPEASAENAPLSTTPLAEDEPTPAGGVSVTVDKLTRPGAMVSGSVTFSDGNSAVWYLDQMGRLGLSAKTPGYRPPPADLQEFQIALENELARSGL